MKFSRIGKGAGSVFIFTAVVICSGAGMLLLSRLIPDAISYTASVTESSVAADESEDPPSLYDSLYVIRENGPYTILAEGQDIYVFSQGTRLYRIKAKLSEFPASDSDAIISGIEICDRVSLYEIAEYLES